MTATDAAILEQLRGAWNRPPEEPAAAEEPMPRENRSGRQEADRLASATLERINAACPSNWKPTAEDWQRIDRAEAAIDDPPDIPAPAPLLLCFYRYGHRTAWQSIYGPHWICAVCHPPVSETVIAEWIDG